MRTKGMPKWLQMDPRDPKATPKTHEVQKMLPKGIYFAKTIENTTVFYFFGPGLMLVP